MSHNYIRTITKKLETTSQTALYAVPSNHKFICFKKQAIGALTGTVRQTLTVTGTNGNDDYVDGTYYKVDESEAYTIAFGQQFPVYTMSGTKPTSGTPVWTIMCIAPSGWSFCWGAVTTNGEVANPDAPEYINSSTDITAQYTVNQVGPSHSNSTAPTVTTGEDIDIDSTSGSITFTDGSGINSVIHAWNEELVKEVFEGGTTIYGTASTSSPLYVSLQGILFDANGVPLESSGNSFAGLKSEFAEELPEIYIQNYKYLEANWYLDDSTTTTYNNNTYPVYKSTYNGTDWYLFMNESRGRPAINQTITSGYPTWERNGAYTLGGEMTPTSLTGEWYSQGSDYELDLTFTMLSANSGNNGGSNSGSGSANWSSDGSGFTWGTTRYIQVESPNTTYNGTYEWDGNLGWYVHSDNMGSSGGVVKRELMGGNYYDYYIYNALNQTSLYTKSGVTSASQIIGTQSWIDVQGGYTDATVTIQWADSLNGGGGSSSAWAGSDTLVAYNFLTVMHPGGSTNYNGTYTYNSSTDRYEKTDNGYTLAITQGTNQYIIINATLSDAQVFTSYGSNLFDVGWFDVYDSMNNASAYIVAGG